jgi:hypothetical protein
VAIPFDLDIFAYAWATLKVIFGSKERLRKNSPPLPKQVEYEEIPETQLTPAQKEYLRPIETQLAALNYRPVCTFRAKNHANTPNRRHLLRRYGNPADAASFGLTVVEVKTTVGVVQGCKNSSTAEFTTRFSDGKRLTTRNLPLKSLFDKPPYRIVQECPNVTNLAELKRKHDTRAHTMGVPVSPRQDVAEIFSELQEEYRRNAEYQIERGNYQLAPDGASYLLTDRVFHRGIRNHFLPFGRRISLVQVLFTALIGAVLPLFGILKVAPWLANNPNVHLLGNLPVPYIGIAMCYVLAGLIMGLTCDAQKFTWIMLVSYLPAHLVAGWSFGWFPYSTLAFNICYFTGQAMRRRKLVLQT